MWPLCHFRVEQQAKQRLRAAPTMREMTTERMEAKFRFFVFEFENASKPAPIVVGEFFEHLIPVCSEWDWDSNSHPNLQK